MFSNLATDSWMIIRTMLTSSQPKPQQTHHGTLWLLKNIETSVVHHKMHGMRYLMFVLTSILLMLQHEVSAQYRDRYSECWTATTRIGCMLFTRDSCIWAYGENVGYHCAPNIYCAFGQCSILDEIWRSSWWLVADKNVTRSYFTWFIWILEGFQIGTMTFAIIQCTVRDPSTYATVYCGKGYRSYLLSDLSLFCLSCEFEFFNGSAPKYKTEYLDSSPIVRLWWQLIIVICDLIWFLSTPCQCQSRKPPNRMNCMRDFN